MVDPFGVLLSRFRFALGEFRDPAGAVPIGNEDVRIGIDEAAMRCAERARLDVARIEVAIRCRGTRRQASRATRDVWAVVPLSRNLQSSPPALFRKARTTYD